MTFVILFCFVFFFGPSSSSAHMKRQFPSTVEPDDDKPVQPPAMATDFTVKWPVHSDVGDLLRVFSFSTHKYQPVDKQPSSLAFSTEACQVAESHLTQL